MKSCKACSLVMLAAAVLGWSPTAHALASDAQAGPFLLAGFVGGTRASGYLGIDMRDVSEDQGRALKLRQARGAEIIRVDHDGPAGKVGLREHDVVLQMNGQTVEGEEQLRRMLRETPPGRTVTLVISRDGQQQTVAPQLANREVLERESWERHLTIPEPPENAGGAPPRAPAEMPGRDVPPGGGPRRGGDGVMSFFHAGGPGEGLGRRGPQSAAVLHSAETGLTLEPMTQQLAEFFGAQGGAGLLVRSVEGSSPAAVAGLRAGDVVVRLNQTAVGNGSDWARAVHENRGKPVQLTVIREKREQTLTMTPDSKRRSAIEPPDAGEGSEPAPGPVLARR